MYAETAAQVQAEVQVPLPCWAALSVVKALRRQYSSQNNIHLGSTMVFTPKHCTGPRPAHPPGLDFSSWHKAHEDEKQCLVSLRAWRITFNFKALSWNEARKNIYMLKTICLNKKKKKKKLAVWYLCATLWPGIQISISEANFPVPPFAAGATPLVYFTAWSNFTGWLAPFTQSFHYSQSSHLPSTAQEAPNVGSSHKCFANQSTPSSFRLLLVPPSPCVPSKHRTNLLPPFPNAGTSPVEAPNPSWPTAQPARESRTQARRWPK